MSTVASPPPSDHPVVGELTRCAALARSGGPGLAGLDTILRRAGDRLNQPMRVAVVGQIKRGKSTLVNALLGREVAATGQLELTFTVNELRYADPPAVWVHYRDRPDPEEMPPDKLREMTVRDPAQLARLRRIRKVEFGLPNSLLRRFHLVDTPGLGSVHGVDSANTTEFLGLSTSDSDAGQVGTTLGAIGRTARDVHRDSTTELDRADAVLYLFSRALHAKDKDAVESFLGGVGGLITPLKAFGVLSRCDQFWPPMPDLPGAPDPMTYDPMAAARSLAEGYLRRPELRGLFYTVLPISGLVGIGGQTLTDEHFTWLGELAGCDHRRLVRSLCDANRFAGAASLTGITLPVEERRLLVERLGAWGVSRAVGYLREKLSPEQTRAGLRADSGVTALEELIVSHFGNRAAQLKLDHGLRDAEREIGRIRLVAQRAGQPVPDRLGEIAAAAERLRAQTPAFAELRALAAYYNGEIRLTDGEAAELLRVTGENGTSAAARLGLPEDTGPGRLAEAAADRVRVWARRGQDPAVDRRTAQAVRTVLRAYERIGYRSRQARELLEADDLTGPARTDEVT